MEESVRKKLRNIVTQCRKLLEEAVSQELQGRFGIHTSPKKDEVIIENEARMTNLTDEERAYRKDLIDHYEHIRAFGSTPKDALAQLIREIAFTHLNRLCAYKMMEARDVYVGGQKFREAVSRSVNSNGVKFFLAEHSDDERLFNTGHQDIAYRHFLDWLGGLLSEEIGILFNPNDPANRLYPPQRVLDDVLALINDQELVGIWTQDETIGWVYQYFTPKELRDQARKESAAPRNSYELAFRNQFFTPRYVVEFLTDNTLGRIWYEMRKGDTKLRDQCRYMVRRPTEIFLAERQQPPKGTSENQDGLSQEELLKQPVYIPYRPKKDPRELKILDPACGSGHFLLYCFDLLLTIYEEAYHDPDLGPPLQRDYPTLEEVRKAVPGLILKHNLHGIDIDLRCTQIAALALWLRCQRAYQEMGLKKDRPKITRSNIVCAEPMPGEQSMLKDFVAQLEPKLLGHLVEVVFDKMKLAGEAGSLLKIEEEIRDTVAAAKRQWLAGPVAIQLSLFGENQPRVHQQTFDFSGITDDQFFEQAENKVIEALRSYAEQARNGQRLQRRLFAEDAERGFAFVETCRNLFDVVLMNPPFGLPTPSVFESLEKQSPETYVEIYASLVSRCLKIVPNGLLGAITSRSFLTMSRLAAWRQNEVLESLILLLDLGKAVMDEAQVESCAFVLSSRQSDSPLFVLDIRLNTSRETAALAGNWLCANPDCRFFSVARTRLRELPGSKILYQLSKSFLESLFSALAFEPTAGEVRTGLTTFDDFRFLRLVWEVPTHLIGRGIYWEFFSKGGDYAKYITDTHLVVNRRKDGEELAEANIACNGQVAQSRQGSKYYYREGLTFTSRSQRGFSVRVLPKGCVISHNAPSIYTTGTISLTYILAWINSRLIRTLVEMQGNFSYYTPGTIKNLPWQPPTEELLNRISGEAHWLMQFYIEPFLQDETSRYFCGLAMQNSLHETYFSWVRHHNEATQRIKDGQHQVSDAIDALYGVSSSDLAIDVLECEPDDDIPLNSFSLEETCSIVLSFCLGVVLGRWDVRCITQGPQLEEGKKFTDVFDVLPIYPPAMLKNLLGQPAITDGPQGSSLRIDWDGVLIDDPDHPDDIVRRVREVLEVIWKDHSDTIEKEACEILGVKELRDYFRKPGKGSFWEDHVSRYSKSRRKAPIYWLLQSSKKNYALWLYYHRLDKDILFKALLNYIEPKIRLEESRLDSLRSQKQAAVETGKGSKKLDKEIEQQDDMLSELRDFEDKLRRAANLHLEPDLNDGVVLNIASLHELVPWKEAKSYWEELLAGKYEWSSIGKQLRAKGLVK